MSVLVTAASRHGSTAEIAGAIGEELRARGVVVTLLRPESVTSLSGYDAVVLGSAVYVGHWQASAVAFAERFGPALAALPVWVFSSGPVGAPAGKLAKAMTTDPAELPRVAELTGFRAHRIFPGKLNPKSLPLGQRLSLLVFRGMTGDFRDWDAARDWAASIAAELAAMTQGTRTDVERDQA
jgi:menaquinone-dependent protoporphyrinogen oxidase